MIRNRYIIIIQVFLYLSALFLTPIGEGLHYVQHLISESTFYFHHHHTHDNHDHHHNYSEILASVFDQEQQQPFVPVSENDLKLNPHNLPFGEMQLSISNKNENKANTPYFDICNQYSGIPDIPPPKS